MPLIPWSALFLYQLNPYQVYKDMAVVIKQQTFNVQQGDNLLFMPDPWANPAHIVNVYAVWLGPDIPQRYKVPLAYMTLFDAFTVQNETTQYEYETRPLIGAGCAIRLIRNTVGTSSVIVYVRKNGLTVPAQIRMRQVNFSI